MTKLESCTVFGEALHTDVHGNITMDDFIQTNIHQIQETSGNNNDSTDIIDDYNVDKSSDILDLPQNYSLNNPYNNREMWFPNSMTLSPFVSKKIMYKKVEILLYQIIHYQVLVKLKVNYMVLDQYNLCS